MDNTIQDKNYNNLNIISLIISFFVFGFFFLIKEFLFESALSISLFSFFILTLLNKLGKELPIKELMVIILSLQLLISPLIAYHYYDNKMNFIMFVDEVNYIPFVLFYIIMFTIGLFIPIFNNQQTSGTSLHITTQVNHGKIGLFLIIFGIISDLLISYIPGSFYFIFYLFSYTRLIGAFFIVYSKIKFKYLLLALVFGQFAYSIISIGLFYDLIIWGFFLYMVIETRLKSSFIRKVALLIIGSMSLMFLQSIKGDYREEIWSKAGTPQSSNFETFINVAEDTNDDNKNTQSVKGIQKDLSRFENLILRLNTGWIVSAVLYHTPRIEPFTNGQTLIKDLKSVLLPRFLAPNKKSVGGKENRKKFKRFTGRQLSEKTTMRIGIISDAYINFGFSGGGWLMLAFGILLNYLIYYLKFQYFNTINYLWIFFIFSFTIRMSDFLVILNSSFKGFIIFLFMKFIINNLQNQPDNLPTYEK